MPSIEIRPAPDVDAVDGAVERLGDFEAIAFTSVNAVDAFFSRLDVLGLDARGLGGLTVAAIGPATAAALGRQGVRADFVPREYTTAALAQTMPGVEGKRVLLPRSAIAPADLLELLAARGARVEQVHVYDTVTPGKMAVPRPRAAGGPTCRRRHLHQFLDRRQPGGSPWR